MPKKRSTPGKKGAATPSPHPPEQNPTITVTSSTPTKADATPKPTKPLPKTPPGSQGLIGEWTLDKKILTKLPKDAIEQIHELDKNVTSAKRNFSEISAGSSPPGKRLRVEDIEARTTRLVEASLEARTALLDAWNGALNVIRAKWHSGELDVPKPLFNNEVERLSRLIAHVQGDVAVLKTSPRQILGQMQDTEVRTKKVHTDDWSYIDDLISRYKLPAHATLDLFKKRTPKDQERFRKTVLNRYNAAKGEKSAWCVISGKWVLASTIRVAHIVRYNVGDVAAQHLFGPPASTIGHLMSAANGIPMSEELEKWFDEGRLVIVPDEEEHFKVVLLDKTLEQDEFVRDYMDGKLDGRRLQFLNEFRPSRRYLYFAFCMNILRRERHEVPGWWKDRFNEMPQYMWASPGEYLRTSTLSKVARRVGHLSEEDAKNFADRSPIMDLDVGDSDEHADEVEADVIAASCLAIRPSRPLLQKDGPDDVFVDTEDREDDGEDRDDDDDDREEHDDDDDDDGA